MRHSRGSRALRCALAGGMVGVCQDVFGRQSRERLIVPGMMVPVDRPSRGTKDLFPRLGFQAANISQVGVKSGEERRVALLRGGKRL